MSTIQDYKLLTIIIPTYNRCREVKENIEITLPQILEHKDKVRLYVSDNASTDDTEKMIEKYTDQYPDLVFYYRQPKNLQLHLISIMLFMRLILIMYIYWVMMIY